MGNEQGSILESIISALINSTFSDVPPSEAEFNDIAEKARIANSSFCSVSDDEFHRIKKRLREYLVVKLDTGICLPDLKNGHQSWLPAKRADIDFFFWGRYKKYLEETKHWNPRVTSKLGQVSDEILDQCGDPKGEDFHIKGLVLGDVQSGKTSNYTAIANKAADVGYEIIIVLAGIPELLRQQTQKRLDKEFCGRQSNLYLDPKSSIKNVPVGVGRYGTKKKIASFTSEASDFNAAVLKSNDLALDNVNCTILLVVKKNKTILNNLYRWLRGNNDLNQNGQIEKSLLLIDDEADNASINTKSEESDPTAINDAIRHLIALFSKSTYLAVTATPFANIFIDPESCGDLFPADFIYSLEAPTNYIGAQRIFSSEADKNGMLELIDVDELQKYFPEKHKKEWIVPDLAPDMYEAANYFLLTNAIRDYRGDVKEHRTMMIHVSRFIKVQGQIAEILNAWLDQVKSDVHNYGKMEVAKSDEIQSIFALHRTWEKFKLSVVSGLTWEDVLHQYLYRAIAPIDVRAVNGSTGSSSLDYDNHKEDGLRVIAIGGNTLSRGLTLEGLVTSYFYRNTNMYDTLMQMGRWFGYRPNYDDLVKIWLSQDAIDWYGQINDATMDLRVQISKMKEAKQSPNDFGLRVRQDPGALIVTARNKMRTAKIIKCPISVSGHLLETPRLIASNSILSRNAEVVERFIDRLSTDGKRLLPENERTQGNIFWENVSGELISELLDNFQTHQWHLSYNGKALASYVSKHDWKQGWDVVIICGGQGKAFPKIIKCGEEELRIPQTEYRKISVSDNMLSVSGTKLKVGSGGCGRIGLTRDEIGRARNEYIKNYNGIRQNPSLPDSAFMIKGRNPILMIHIIEANYKNDAQKYPDFLYALGVGFPSDGTNEIATYQVNLVELKNWMEIDDGMDE